MKFSFFTAQLNDNAERIAGLVRDVSDVQAQWKPDPNSWSMIEVINHLLDEEREDFRVRLNIILYHPDQPWPPIDPEGWAVKRKYNQKGLQVSVGNFLAERKASLDWLGKLVDPDWGAAYSAPFGSMKAGDMLASWAAHDHLHMRQLIELHHLYAALQASTYIMDYAGQW